MAKIWATAIVDVWKVIGNISSNYNSCGFLLTVLFPIVILKVLSGHTSGMRSRKFAGVAELVYAYVSEAYGESLESSNLSSGTNIVSNTRGIYE